MYLRRVIASFALGLAATTSGCSPGGPTAEPSRSAPGSQPSPRPTQRTEAEAKAVAVYIALWKAMAKAGETADPDAPEVRLFASGDALAAVVRALVTYRETGVVTKGAPVNSPRVTAATPAGAPTVVNLADCGDSTNWTTHKRTTGELIKDDPRGRRTITAVVKLSGGLWKVTSFEVGNIGSC